MPNTREKLIELQKAATREFMGSTTDVPLTDFIADYLIANGVTVQEQIRDCHWATEQAYKNGYNKGKADALKWIPVTERLPDLELEEAKANDMDLYPCLVAEKHPRAQNGRFVQKAWYNGRGFLGCNTVCFTENITHWMSLPEPTKGE